MATQELRRKKLGTLAFYKVWDFPEENLMVANVFGL